MRLTVHTFVSLDGVMQGPGGPGEDQSGGFDLGGWQVPYVDEDTMRLVAGWFEAADAFLLGRRTYEIFAAHWPRVTDPADPVAAKLNRLPKYVASRSLEKAEWNNSTVITGELAAGVAELKRRPGNELQVHGSGNLVRSMLEKDLVDEYRLLTYPVILGRGQRLLEPGSVPTALELVDVQRTGSGAVVSRYRRAGEMKFGSFLLD